MIRVGRIGFFARLGSGGDQILVGLRKFVETAGDHLLLLEQFQQKCAAVLRPELRENKRSERFRVSVKNGNALSNALFRTGRQPGSEWND
ncbi:hypothetical protein CYK37_15770 [Mesorhizobium loti]|nr:hypothetical protein CYK37_15770 [Mesorhizobium loti]